MALTFFWHDYETWGADPRRDRAAQFAGLRTDADLNPVGQPLVLYCRPADDMLPQPEACLVTGITPQHALREGVVEAEFFAAIHQELSRPGTCGVGYNSVRFDDEFTRYGLYRNFYDPYAREWQNGNSRWDIIDMVRLTHALRPEGIEWPKREDGATSFRLEELTAANGISHAEAHDALSDVHATIGLARLIKQRQPRLFDYLLALRNKHKVSELLQLGSWQPMLHVSSMFPATQGCIAPVVPLAQHPANPNGVIVYDLRQDPGALIELGAEQVRHRLFTPRDMLAEGKERIPLKTLHINKCPVVVPINTLTPEAGERWQIDLPQVQQHLDQLRAAPGLLEKLAEVHQREIEPVTDPDQALYAGGFFSREDRQLMDQLLLSEPAALASRQWQFGDPRLPELLFRYRARNWPETLSMEERARWQEYRLKRVSSNDGGGSITLEQYQSALARLMVERGGEEGCAEVLSDLADWPYEIGLA